MALTRGLDALRLLDKNDRQLIMTSFRNQMTSLENQFVPKHYSDQLSSTDHSLGRHLPDAELNLAQREFSWLDEVDFDELYHEDGLSITNDQITPEGVDTEYVGWVPGCFLL
jgi:hypothetical protein